MAASPLIVRLDYIQIYHMSKSLLKMCLKRKQIITSMNLRPPPTMRHQTTSVVTPIAEL